MEIPRSPTCWPWMPISGDGKLHLTHFCTRSIIMQTAVFDTMHAIPIPPGKEHLKNINHVSQMFLLKHFKCFFRCFIQCFSMFPSEYSKCFPNVFEKRFSSMLTNKRFLGLSLCFIGKYWIIMGKTWLMFSTKKWYSSLHNDRSVAKCDFPSPLTGFHGFE